MRQKFKNRLFVNKHQIIFVFRFVIRIFESAICLQFEEVSCLFTFSLQQQSCLFVYFLLFIYIFLELRQKLKNRFFLLTNIKSLQNQNTEEFSNKIGMFL